MRPALALPLIAVLALTGCVAEPPVVLPSEEASSSPVFASDEEALAAAEEAYGAYLKVVDLISAESGDSPERLLEVATREVLEYELPGFEQYQNEKLHATGATVLDTVSLQSADLSGKSPLAIVTIYACEDYSGVDVLDSDGVSVVFADRKTRWPVTVTFDFTGQQSSPLIVSLVEDWTGDDFCAA